MNQYQTENLEGEIGIQRAVEILRNGDCVALPTETVYGLAADAMNADAVNKIFEAKGRPKNHPLIVHLPDVSHLPKWAKSVPDLAYRVADSYWPGALTMLFEKADAVPDAVTGGLNTVAIRVPSHPTFLSVLKSFDGGLAAPSANRYKQLSPTSAEHVLKGLDGRIAAVLDGGSSALGLESTIIDVMREKPRILRAGPVTQTHLQNTLNIEVLAPEIVADVVPGNVKAHYQPDTPLQIYSSETLQSRVINQNKCNVFFVVWSDALADVCHEAHARIGLNWIRMSADPARYGQALYSTLYDIDKLGLSNVFIEQPPNTDAWRAINDRLKRASS